MSPPEDAPARLRAAGTRPPATDAPPDPAETRANLRAVGFRLARKRFRRRLPLLGGPNDGKPGANGIGDPPPSSRPPPP